jgi:hypothetical protein
MVAKKSEGDDVVAPQADEAAREVQEPVGVKYASVVNALEGCAASGTAQEIATRLELMRVSAEGGTTSEAQAKRATGTVERALKELEEAGQVWSRDDKAGKRYFLESTFPRAKNNQPG